MNPLSLAVPTKIARRVASLSDNVKFVMPAHWLACWVCLGTLLGIQQTHAQVSTAESVAFELDLRPPGSNPDAVSSGESAWFTLDLALGVSFAESATFILDLREPKDPGYEAWLDLHFTEEEKLIPTVTDEDADPDLDGQDNWFEYIAALDPRDRDSSLKVHYTSRERDYFRFSPISDQLEYTVQYSEDLENWTSFEESRLTMLENEIEVDITGLPEALFHRVLVANPNIVIQE